MKALAIINQFLAGGASVPSQTGPTTETRILNTKVSDLNNLVTLDPLTGIVTFAKTGWYVARGIAGGLSTDGCRVSLLHNATPYYGVGISNTSDVSQATSTEATAIIQAAVGDTLQLQVFVQASSAIGAAVNIPPGSGSVLSQLIISVLG